MKKVLGIDLGVSSIGWALVDEEKKQILGMGSRIIPLTTEDRDEFTKGNAISKNQKRTAKRTQRKGYDRYRLRRKKLIDVLKQNDMLPGLDLIKLSKLELWKIRSEAISKRLTLKEIGRILLHLNQKRGYKSSRSEANMDKKDTEYVTAVKSRYDKLKENKLTIGQKFYEEIAKNQFYRIKEQVFPREAYIEEYELIMKNQQKYYPDIMTDELIDEIRSEIIYFQRGLKSQKSIVSVCEFEGFWTKINSNGKEKELFVGPKVAPKSSPLFQVNRTWETINSISLRRKTGEPVEIELDKKQEIFKYMDNNERLSYAELLKILGLKKDEVYGNKQLANGLPGNKIKVEMMKCVQDFEKYADLFQLKLSIKEFEEEVYLFDKKSGEIINTKNKKQISAEVENQPFYKLWHVVYSIPEKDYCKKTLIKKFGLPEEDATKLAALDFTKQGFANKSHRAIRKLLPYLMEGDNDYSARCYAGYHHTTTITKQENFERKLLNKLKLVEKNSLRQPVVEKILNQMVNVVNAIIDKYGKPEEIRIELARELKQSREERNDAYKSMNERERENKIIEKELAEFGLRATRNNIIKWRLYHEISDEEKKQNAICIYCGQPISFTAAILGEEVEVEHIIPRSRLFDDSQSNKTLAHKKCNSDKKDQTAYDFMRSKSDLEFEAYVERINTLYRNHIIGKTKRDKLLMPANKIPDDFIDRQLRQTQYISRKAREILQSICYNVSATSGSVTAELRHIWGWDEILENLQLPKYKELGLTEIMEIESVGNGKKYKREKIIGWTKRDDHRHHAIDALTIACTKQGFVQRFNTLSSGSVRKEMRNEIINYDDRKSLLDNYILSQKPFTTKEVEKEAERILVSFKAGKKVASTGKRKIKKDGRKTVVQTGIIIPRGALSEESVYGKIKVIVKEKPLKYLFENPHLILKPYIKTLVEERLYKHDNDPKSALASLKKNPIYLDKEKTIELKYGTCYKEEVVIKKPLQSLNEKQVEDIVDPVIKGKVKEHLENHGGKAKEAFKDLENNPVWYDEERKIPIKNVRWFTGLSAIEPVSKDEQGKEIGFVKPGNNHHLAIYLDEAGNKKLSICSFWHAVERKKYGLPVIIKNPAEVVDIILAEEDEEKYPDSFLEKLPDGKWTFLESFQQNEMFILGISKEAFDEAILRNDYGFLSCYLYRVQKIFYNVEQFEIFFRHHLETQLKDDKNSKLSNRFYQIRSLGTLESLSPQKVKINYLGEIVANSK
jgi:CRISPR-associated endonuclease Csn1